MNRFDFRPSFTRYSPAVTAKLVRINSALAVIRRAHVWPAAADQLRFAALVGTIHYSSLIEGNPLGMLEAARAARKDLDAQTRAEVELINYVDALDLIARRAAEGTLDPLPQLLKDIHYETTKGLGREEDPHFKPRHEGHWRDGRAYVVDRLTGRVMHEAPPQEDVEPRVDALCSWIRVREVDLEKHPPFVLAGIAHFAVTDIHPFADGNGRVARLFAAALLERYDVLPGRLFSFERHYGENQTAYYEALRSVERNTLNHNEWLEYFLEGLALEYERVETEVDALAVLGRSASGQPVQLTPTQQAALSALHIRGRREFTRTEYQEVTGTGRGGALGDLRHLIDNGVILPVGEGPRRRYRFPTALSVNPWTGRGGGRPREWDDERIERELREMIGTSGRFPTQRELTEAGRRALLSAVQRNGGSATWARRMGVALAKPGRR